MKRQSASSAAAMKSSLGMIPVRPIIQPNSSLRWVASMLRARFPDSHCATEKQTPSPTFFRLVRLYSLLRMLLGMKDMDRSRWCIS